MKKLFVVRKYVWAKNASEALKNERNQKADECWIEEKWQEKNIEINKNIKTAGFIIKKHK